MKVVIYYLRAEEYVISSGGSWLPGIYADIKAARWAYQFSNVVLAQLTDMINVGEGRSITTEDLRKAKRGE